MNLLNKIQHVCYYGLLASVAAFISFVIVRNFELVFGRVSKMRRTGELMNDLGHVFICLLLLWLLIAIYRHFFQFSWSHFKSNKRLLLIFLIPILPILFLIIGIFVGYFPHLPYWYLSYGISADTVFFSLAALCFLSIVCYFGFAWKCGAFYTNKSWQLHALFKKLDLQLFILICLILIPHWGDSYWLLIFKNDYLSSLNYGYFAIPFILTAATCILRNRMELNKAFYIAQINVILIYFCVLGYINYRPFKYKGPLLEAIFPLVTAALIWLLNWIIWHKNLPKKQIKIVTRRRVRYSLSILSILMLWQFISYFWYADDCRQQIVWRFINDVDKQDGIYISNINDLPQNQREYLIKKLSKAYKKVYTDKKQFADIETDRKYPVLYTNLKHSGLFYSKGYCGCSIGYGTKVSTIWFLGRWWYVYTSRSIIS
jgi:hypothetical protein